MIITLRQPLAFTQIGGKDTQEDRIFPPVDGLKHTDRCFVLCDGMGGHEKGEVASTLVSEALGRYFAKNMPPQGIATKEFFNQGLKYAYSCLDTLQSESTRKPGTTMTCVYFARNGALVAHIGDSRIYHIRPGKGILYQSSDHSLVNDLLKAGELTPEEAENYPRKNIITRAMQPGLDVPYRADIFLLDDIKPGDYFFMCCDGILEKLKNDRLVEILSRRGYDEDKLAEIKAICDTGTKDNYTCILIPVEDAEPERVDMIRKENQSGRPVPQRKPLAGPAGTANARKSWIMPVLWGTAMLIACAALIFIFLGGNKNDKSIPATATEQPVQQRSAVPDNGSGKIPVDHKNRGSGGKSSSEAEVRDPERSEKHQPDTSSQTEETVTPGDDAESADGES